MAVTLRILCFVFLCASAAVDAAAQGNPPLAPNVEDGTWWEPSIAFDPTDATHQHLILANGFDIWSSSDGGKTFTTLTGSHDLPFMSSCGDGIVSFDSKGHLFWIHLECANAIASVAVDTSSEGSGYQVGDTLTVVKAGAGSGSVQVTSVGPNGAVTGVSIAQVGGGYSVGFPTTGGHGGGAGVNITGISPAGAITSASTSSSSGSGYQVGDTLAVVENGASGGTVRVNSTGTNGNVAAITVSHGGTGYTTGFPTTGGHGSGFEVDITSTSVWLAVIEQIDSNTGLEVGTTCQFVIPGLYYDDKPWLVADSNPNSPFRDNVYAVWSRDVFNSQTDWFQLYFSKYDPVAQAWSTPVALTSSSSQTVWPAFAAVAKSGDLYITYQFCPPENQGCEVEIIHSADGGVGLANGQIPPPITVISPGSDDFNSNNPNSPPTIPHDSVLVFEPGATVVPDDVKPGRLYVFANTTSPTNPISDTISMSVSTDSGAHWTAPPTQVGDAPPGTVQIMPSAATDGNGNLVVKWYDNRDGLTDAAGNYEFSVYATISRDGGNTWVPDFRINTQPIVVLDDNDRHLGEYTALAGQQGLAYAAWINGAGSNGPCSPGCFDVFSTAVPAVSVTTTSSKGGCANGQVQAVATDNSGKPLQGQRIQFSVVPGFPFVGPSSSLTDINGSAWTEISNPSGFGGEVLVTAVDSTQPPPQNASQAPVYFSSAIQCRTDGLAKCVPDICGPSRVRSGVSIQSIIGCSTGLCNHPSQFGDWTIQLGDNFTPAEVLLRTPSFEESARLSKLINVNVLSESSAAEVLKSNPDIVSPDISGPITNFVGPVVEIKADRSVSREKLAFDLVLPHSAGLQANLRLDVVRLGISNGRREWSAAGISVTKRTQTTISARVVGSGTYTVIAQKVSIEVEAPYSHGETPK
jgi:hypothetical protein